MCSYCRYSSASPKGGSEKGDPTTNNNVKQFESLLSHSWVTWMQWRCFVMASRTSSSLPFCGFFVVYVICAPCLFFVLFLCDPGIFRISYHLITCVCVSFVLLFGGYIMSFWTILFMPSRHTVRPRARRDASTRRDAAMAGRHYLSNATCLIQPHFFYAHFVVSRIILCCIRRHLWRKPVLDK